MKTLRTLAACAMLGSSLLLVPTAFAQNNLQPKSATAQTPGPQNWSKEQLLTSTVHQAWLLSGKNEATFFEMVKQLAELSATNRGIDLPDDEATGRRFGNYVKTTAKADTDQLLYAVVDKAVVMTSKTTIHKAGQPR
jgi:hypothetical protein